MIVIAYKPGQLANRLFLFAKFVAYGHAHNVFVLNPAFDDYLTYFEKTRRQLIPATRGLNFVGSKAIARTCYLILFYSARILHKAGVNSKFISITYLDWVEHFDLDNDLKLSRKGVHLIQGWEFQADKLLIKYKSEIRNFFSPAREYQNAVDVFLKNLSGESRKIIGVHVRQGDYKHFKGGKYFYETVEYEMMMKKLASVEPDILFIVCTNNSKLTKSHFEGLNVRMSPGHPLVDLYVLSRCDYILGPPSTYSLWASYFGGVPLYQIEDPGRSFNLTDFKAYLHEL